MANTLTQAVQTFRPIEIAIVIAFAVIAGCIPALQPILLGGLHAAHRLSATQMGQAATLEALGMAVSVTIVTAFVRPTHLRAIAAGAAFVLAIANGRLSHWRSPLRRFRWAR